MTESKRLAGTVIVKVVPWSTHHVALDRVRELVFIREQGVPTDIVSDGQDQLCRHFVLEDRGQPIGCGRLQTNGKIERMAVLLPYRNTGLGADLLDFIINYARENDYMSLHLHAQVKAVSFYQRAGFLPEGPVFEEAGIQHQGMRLKLTTATQGFIKGVSYPKPFDELSLKLAESARRELRIYSPTLEHLVFDNEAWSTAISSLIRSSRESRVRILITDSQPIVKRGHRLLRLARRLPSSITIHKLGTHPEITDECYVVRDLDGIIYKPAEPGSLGFYEPDSRAYCKRFTEQFDLLWEKSIADPELRQLSL
ncbi:MAG: putative GNAT family N-acyltransferase [Halieaceae bacterium]|jgi:predicted GNAT family N-acyltransferase